MLIKKKHSVGLYIGTQKIVMAQIHEASASLIIDSMGAVDMPPEAFEDDGTVNSSVVSRLIRELVTTYEINAKDVSLTISAVNSIIMRSLTLPSMPKKETTEALRGEVENYAILSSESPILDYQVMGQSFEGTGQKSEILLVAAPKGLIRSYVAAIESANLKMTSIETASISILRILNNYSGEKSDETETSDDMLMMVSIEESGGTITIANSQRITFIHNIEIGLSSIEDGSSIPELANEINSSIEYYQTAFPNGDAIKAIVLYMDGQDIKGISEKLGESLSIPVVIPSVPGKMDETSTNIIQGNGFSAYAAIGAAMRSKGDECISLLPTRGAEITNIKSKVFAVVLVALSTTLLSIGGELLINAKVKSIRNSTTKIRQERSRSDDNILTPVSGIETNIAQMKSQVELINYTMSTIDRVRWFEVLPEVSIIIPRNIWLTSLGWQEGNNDESNKVILSGSAMTYESVFRFIDTIGESSYFRSPNLIFIRKYKLDDLQILQFEIQAQAVVEKMERRNEIANS